MFKDGCRWTPEEDEIIRVEYPLGRSIAFIAEHLNRRPLTVSYRVKKLKLRLLPEVALERERSRIAKLPRKNDSTRFIGCGKISGSYYGRLRWRRTKLPITVTVQYLDSITTDICPLSGRQLTYPRFARDTSATASLDRIDSSQGYIEGNLRWIHKDLNIMKSNMSDREFLEWVKDIAAYHHE